MKSISYHPKVGGEAGKIFQYYTGISEALGNDFWRNLQKSISEIQMFPERHHFDSTGARRANLEKFPVHLLFRELADSIRVIAVRHDKANPIRGSKRR